MKESQFVDIFQSVSSEVSRDFVVKRGTNLLYQLMLNRNLQLSVDLGYPPMRGESAFQTDVCIFEISGGKEFPRVVIEFKTDITTHDVLTYSAKAGKHKKIYPWLRYGLLASEIDSIPKRFFIHNEYLDFFIAAKKYTDNAKLRIFAKELISQEIKISRTLEKIQFDNEKFDFFRTDIVFENFSK
jgi:hypothetical protein